MSPAPNAFLGFLTPRSPVSTPTRVACACSSVPSLAGAREAGLPLTFGSLAQYSRGPGCLAELTRWLWTGHSMFPMTRGAQCYFLS